MTHDVTEELRALLAKATPGPWEYRPYEFDDWGFIRGPEIELSIGPCKPVVAIAREGGVQSDDDEHRRNKTDPYGPNAALIVAAVNALPGMLDTIAALSARNAEMEAALADIFEHFKDRDQPPGHCHDVPGIWDSDNGDRAGEPCDWCAKWNRARAVLQSETREC